MRGESFFSSIIRYLYGGVDHLKFLVLEEIYTGDAVGADHLKIADLANTQAHLALEGVSNGFAREAENDLRGIFDFGLKKPLDHNYIIL